jgi:hypothetical protein
MSRRVNQVAVPFDVIMDLGLEARHQHPQRPLRDQLIEHQHQVVAVGVVGDYLQHQAYSFPAGCNQRIPVTQVWKGTPPSFSNPVIHNIWL